MRNTRAAIFTWGPGVQVSAGESCRDLWSGRLCAPGCRRAADRKRRYVCSSCQIFVSNENLDATRTSLADPGGETERGTGRRECLQNSLKSAEILFHST
jgi:hypothetical protein